MALDPALFSLLGIYNGGWLPPTTNTQGTGGNDRMTYNRAVGSVGVNGGAGNDHITIQGGVVNTVNGGEGSDQIYGGTGADTILGGNGNDFIEGGAGLDTITGGAGNDTVSYEHATGDVTVTLTALGAGTSSGGGMGLDVFLSGIENVVGSDHDDTITGNADINLLFGLNGDDSIHGGGGNDTIYGGHGNDLIIGGDGNDTLTGDTGIDTLIGGDGNDRFVFKTLDEAERIADFDYDVDDLIDVSQIDADLTVAGNQAFVFIGEVSDPAREVAGGGLGFAISLSAGVTTLIVAQQKGGGQLRIHLPNGPEEAPLDEGDFIL